jgi:hypothetical protein
MILIRKTDLPFEGQRLVEEMQQINFGRLEYLPVRNGLPGRDKRTRIIRTVKLGGENEPRPEHQLGNFELKREVIELFSRLRQLGNGLILSLEVKYGLPFVMDVEEDADDHFSGASVPTPIPHTHDHPTQLLKEELAAV